MSNDRLGLCFGVHNHQPIGNFDTVVREATELAYRPLLGRLADRPEIRLTIHCTGSLLEWLRERAPETFDLLGMVVARGQVELLTGGFYEPILAVLPDHDKLGQIGRLTEFLKGQFGVRPRGMWLAERVWEPHLPRALREAGVEYVLVDDSHFALAGLDPETIGGHYLTEEQGAVVGVFPISQRLRYLIPFADVDESLAYLERRRGTAPVLTVVDDGEKLGAWPGTHALVYERGWLDRFFDRVLATPWLELMTFADAFARWPATDRVYLPSASYREMGEWALPVEAGRDLARAKRELGSREHGAALARLLRGGFWRSFLVKYPEVGDSYWKMLRLSDAIHHEGTRRPADVRLAQARLALWRGQANDAYWHGVFGGCYLPHLRRAVKQSLLEAERLLAEVTQTEPVVWSRGDVNGDGREEIVVRTRELAVTVNPERGGTLTEIGWLATGLDLADVLTRRPELYHDEVRARTSSAAPAEAGLEALLAYDEVRRASLTDGLGRGDVDPVAPWGSARFTLAHTRLEASIERRDDGVAIVMTRRRGDASGVGVEKRVTIRGGSIEARYRIGAGEAPALDGRWLVQWNLALTAGEASDRYLRLPGRRPSLGSRGRETGTTGVSLVDEWIGVEASLSWSPGAELGWGPVETVSVSESGFERIYQGTALTLAWPLREADLDLWTTLTVRAR